MLETYFTFKLWTEYLIPATIVTVFIVLLLIFSVGVHLINTIHDISIIKKHRIKKKLKILKDMQYRERETVGGKWMVPVDFDGSIDMRCFPYDDIDRFTWEQLKRGKR